MAVVFLGLLPARGISQPNPAQDPNQTGPASAPQVDSEGDPQTADEAYRRATRLLQTQHVDNAIAMFGKAIALRPDWALALGARGRAEYQAKQYTAALKDVDRAIQLDAGHADWYNLRGLSYSYLGQHERAIEDYNRAIELDPRVPAYFNDRGWAYRELGQFEEAIADLSHAIQLAPDYARAFENRGITYQRMKDWAHAITDFTAAIEIAPNKTLYGLRADARLAAGDQAGAVEDRNKGAAPLPPGVYRIGGGVSSPTLAFKVEPKYSEQAQKARVEGKVVLSVVVTPEGTLRDIKVVRSLGLGLDEKAIEAVSQWKFAPGMKDGKPVAVIAAIEVNFQLQDKPHR